MFEKIFSKLVCKICLILKIKFQVEISTDLHVDLKYANGVVIARKKLDDDQHKKFKMHHKVIAFVMNVITFKEFDKISDNETTKCMLTMKEIRKPWIKGFLDFIFSLWTESSQQKLHHC